MASTSISFESIQSLESELIHLAAVLHQKETEDSWTLMDDALTKVAAVIRGSHHLPGLVLSFKKHLKQGLIMALSTERTRLARTGMMVVEVLARSLGDRFEPLAEFTLPALLKLCARANKVIVACANSALKTVFENVCLPSAIPLLLESLQSQSKTVRTASAECIIIIMESNSSQKLEHHLDTIEASIRLTAVDSMPEVRALSKRAFEVFGEKFPQRMERFVASLSDIAAKYLKVSKTSGSVAPRKTLSIRSKPPSAGTKDAFASETDPIVWDNDDNTSSTSSIPKQRPKSFMDNITTQASSSVPSSQSRPRPISMVSTTGTVGTALASSLNGPSRRLLNDKGSRQATNEPAGFTPVVTHLKDHSGGALRVPKEEGAKDTQLKPAAIATVLPSRSRAMRVPLATVAPSAETLVNHSNYDDHGDKKEKLRRPLSMTPASTANSNIPMKGRPVSMSDFTSNNILPTVSIPDSANSLKSSDWAVRLKTLEGLNAYVSASIQPLAHPTLVSETKSRLSKLLELYLMGLQDNHAKCVSCSVSGLNLLAEHYDCDDGLVEVMIPRLAGSVFHQYTGKGTQRPALLQSGQKLLELIRLKNGADVIVDSAAQALHNPEFSKGIRTRAGCIAILSEIPDQDWASLYTDKPAVLRTVVLRILAIASDADLGMQKLLKPIYAALNELAPVVFWSGWSSARAAERKAVNNMFGSKDISMDKKELIAARKTVIKSAITPDKITPSKIITTEAFKQTPKSSSSQNTPTPALHANARALHSSPLRGEDAFVAGRSFSASPAMTSRTPYESNYHSDSQRSSRRRPVESESSDELSGAIHSKFTGAFEDSDTDWMTESEVLRSPDGDSSDNYQGNSSENEEYTKVGGVEGSASGVEDVKSKRLSQGTGETPKLKTKHSLKNLIKDHTMTDSPTISLEQRLEDERVQNIDVIKELDEALMKLEHVERSHQKVVQEKSVEALSRSSTLRASTVGPNLRKSGIPMLSSGYHALSPGSHVPGALLPSKSPSPRPRLSPSPTGDNMMMSRTSSLPGPSFKSSPSVTNDGSAKSVRSTNRISRDIAPEASITPERVNPAHSSGSTTVPFQLPLRSRSSGHFHSVPSTPSSLKHVVGVEILSPVETETSTPPQKMRKDSWVSDVTDLSTTSDVDIEVEFDKALTEGIDSLWVYFRKKVWRDLSTKRADQVAATVISQLQKAEELPATTIRNGLQILKDVLVNHSADTMTHSTGTLIALLTCEQKSQVTADDQLEIDYETDSIFKLLADLMIRKNLLHCIVEVFESSDIPDFRSCFELVGRTVSNSNDELSDESWPWPRIMGSVAQGLDSTQATTRKAAFDCALALCRKYGPPLSNLLFEEVGKRKDKSRQLIIKGMLERRLH